MVLWFQFTYGKIICDDHSTVCFLCSVQQQLMLLPLSAISPDRLHLFQLYDDDSPSYFMYSLSALAIQRDNVKTDVNVKGVLSDLAPRWKRTLHHQGSIAISLEWESGCRMEIDSFTLDGLLKKKKKRCWTSSVLETSGRVDSFLSSLWPDTFSIFWWWGQEERWNYTVLEEKGFQIDFFEGVLLVAMCLSLCSDVPTLAHDPYGDNH